MSSRRKKQQDNIKIMCSECEANEEWLTQENKQENNKENTVEINKNESNNDKIPFIIDPNGTKPYKNS